MFPRKQKVVKSGQGGHLFEDRVALGGFLGDDFPMGQSIGVVREGDFMLLSPEGKPNPQPLPIIREFGGVLLGMR